MRPIARLFASAVLTLALASPAPAKDTFWAQVTFLKGSATVTTAGSPQAQPLKLGAVLHLGVMVKTAEASQVSLLRNDGGVLVVRSSSEVILGKTQVSPVLPLKTVAGNLSKTLLTREGDNPMLKHLGGLRGAERNLALAPCRTKTRRDGVRLVWVAKPGVAKYAVTLMGPDDAITEFTSAETSVAVPSQKLQTVGVYYWEVRDAATKDTLSILGSGTFTTLDPKVEAEVRSLEKALKEAYPEMGEDSTPQFLAFQIYREKGLNLDALMVLNRMLAPSPANGELLQMRKDLCEEMGLIESGAAGLLPGTP
jgi:hypothetical protein